MARQDAATTHGSDSESSAAGELASLAKALGHPARIGIIKMLYARKICIGCDIVDEIGLAQSTTSEHLRILKSAGLITGDIDPPKVCYSLNAERLAPLMDFLGRVSGPSRQKSAKPRRAQEVA